MRPGASSEFEAVIEEFHPVWRERGYEGDFDSCVRSVADDFAAFLAKAPEVPAEFAEARALYKDLQKRFPASPVVSENKSQIETNLASCEENHDTDAH